MNYLTTAQVLFIHSRLLAETGGRPGLRDLGMLESAVARPQATFDGQDLYPEICSKAAAMLESLVLNHPFIDGNKRVGITAAGIFLRRNGRRLNASGDEVEAFTVRVAQGEAACEEIAGWLADHSILFASDST